MTEDREKISEWIKTIDIFTAFRKKQTMWHSFYKKNTMYLSIGQVLSPYIILSTKRTFYEGNHSQRIWRQGKF